jgi:hypothetical protein
MARQIFSSIFSIILFASLVSAQAPDTEWTRIYEFGPGTCIRQIIEGDYILSTNMHWYRATGSILKLDVNGTIIWNDDFLSYEAAGMNSVAQGADRNFVVFGWGSTLFGNPHAWTISVDSDGVYYPSGLGPSFSEGRWVEPATDSGYILLGFTYHSDGGVPGIWLQKMGSHAWYKSYGSSSTEYPGSVKPSIDGGYIISASTSIDTIRHFDGYLIKTDSIGDTNWTKTYGGSANDYFAEVEATNDNGFIVTGSTSSFGMAGSDIWIVRTDSLGDTLWTRTYGTPQNDAGLSIKAIQSSGYIISGSMAGRACLLRIDDNGDSLWTKTFDGATNAASITLTSDGGYAITGTWEPSDSFPPQLWVAKLAPDVVNIHDDHSLLPKNTLTARNYPNPFNSSTMISWSGSDVEKVEIFNIMGQKIRTLPVESNNIKKIVWDAKDSHGNEIGAGVYFAKVIGKENSATIKLIYLK